MNSELLLNKFNQLELENVLDVLAPIHFLRKVSGTYRSPDPCGYGKILELRVDVDGYRTQKRLSGDFYTKFYFCGWIKFYTGSFVVENVDVDKGDEEITLSGPIIYYNDPGKVNDTIHVSIPRASIFKPAPPACVNIFTSGSVNQSYLCPKTSEYLRTVTLEIDRFQGTTFPPEIDPDINPSPNNLPSTVSVESVFKRSGIDMTVIEDDVLNDADSNDTGSNWDEGELHDLMEDRFDQYTNKLQWVTYGVVVPRFGDPNYNSGYYGTMFDWGPWQSGDTYHRQGAAIAYDAIQGRSSGTLYNTAAKKERLLLQTFIHEIGHSFNLPHSWQRSNNPDMGSESFMNYPWNYTNGGESGFWSDFRWEFDDEELIWMRHADRNDVIFGGRDWIGNNLSIYTAPEMEMGDTSLSLEVRTPPVVDFGQPVRVEFKLKNISNAAQKVANRFDPEDGLMQVFIQRPNGEIVQYVPPLRRLKAPPEATELAPGDALYQSVLLSFGAKGLQFQEPGEYVIRAFLPCYLGGLVVSRSHRVRVARPFSRASEELAHLLFSREASKILYFGGSERYPDTLSKLEEATEKYAESDPIVVRTIHAALGQQASRSFKQVVIKDGKRVIVQRDAKMKSAIEHFENARSLLPERKISALDNITYNRLSVKLADCYLNQKQRAKAEETLRQTRNYFAERGVIQSVLKEYDKRIKAVSDKKKG